MNMNDTFWKYTNQLEEVEHRLLELYKKDRDMELKDFYNYHVSDLKAAWKEHDMILGKIEELRK